MNSTFFLRLLREVGDYDSAIAGAVGEVYAEEKLGMLKAERGCRGIDGYIGGRSVSVKTKEKAALNHHYVPIRESNYGVADDLLVVIIDGDDVSHLGPIEFAKLEYYEKPDGSERRYKITKIVEVVEKVSGNLL